MALNPFQKNKVDVSSLTEEEQKLFRLYGKLPNKKDLLQNKLQERKYFDSGDYAMSKAGKASDGGVTSIGKEHPHPENIPHLSSPGPNGTTNPPNGEVHRGSIPGATSGSPVKESSFLQRETSAEDPNILSPKSPQSPVNKDVTGPPAKEGIPIRWQSSS
ncbi:uncharacterized protein KY384_006895 [Bacidia gigantensis]|uniref:uncharacterized protein n=1 Tax=Bacidia gigantensis TaxID=2732470 RepID=UPI001D048D69|nr:uncharacterized protein KY384_006895 [Bacidia gigantensis]KAG8527979.1 hypothetical protein KY384_006895 [Bacidia gigantensis]